MERHNELLRAVEAAEDVNTVVTYRRKDFTSDFFEHVQLLSQTHQKNPERAEGLNFQLFLLCCQAKLPHSYFQNL